MDDPQPEAYAREGVDLAAAGWQQADPPRLLEQANALYQNDRLTEAERLYSAVGVRPDPCGAEAEAAGAGYSVEPGYDAPPVRPPRGGAGEPCRGALPLRCCGLDPMMPIQPDDAQALNSRGIALCELGRFEEALTSWDRALAIRPDYAEALNNRSVALHKLGRFEEALKAYDRTLTIRPDFAEALVNRGHLLRELRRFAEACGAINRL